MILKRGRFGQFLACTGYPECKTTRKIASGSSTPKKPDLVVAGLSLVGLAFDQQETLMVVDAGSLYRVRLGVMGKPLP